MCTPFSSNLNTILKLNYWLRGDTYLILYEAVTYVEADNKEEAAKKAKEQFERDAGDVQYMGHHWDEEIAIQTKVDGEYGDEELVRPAE